MFVYKVRVRAMRTPSSNNSTAQALTNAAAGLGDGTDLPWLYEVSVCHPHEVLIGKGTAKTEGDAVADAMRLLDHSEREAWMVTMERGGDVHLSRQ